ncbi:molybdenum cofactor cytidylyltransferase [Christiangramia gaetbulicola]|uniref:Molybdenum cofactor cytidylyltransferase n=1 Tax=Christiangramia gaetbulicola TaxID=703340 RepID=A0A2T6ACC2_9FLAO|nr:nucleotidyltransferase family protein [Christiangramia gaetbulicola]PTX41464.1 molybdenum cofactor cytidylyltransferase [Christiangramia gaetbulicola]
MRNYKKIGVVILAAGSSSRLGYPKQLVEFKGKPMLQHIIDVADSFEFETEVLVLGAASDEIKEKIEPKKFEILFNENWQEGMASSIRTGLERSLEKEQDLEHLLILLSDQPFVSKERIDALIKEQLAGNSEATFSEYDGDVGVPAIFSSSVFPYLKELKGDLGAKKLIYDKKIEFRTVKFEKGNFDVDTKEDVELLKKLEKE